MRILLSAAVLVGLGRFALPALSPGGPAAGPTAEAIEAVQAKQGQMLQRVLRGGGEPAPEAAFRVARERAEAEAVDVARVAARTPGQTGAVRAAYAQARLAAEFGPDRARGAWNAATRAEAHNGQVGREIGERVGREAGPDPGSRTRELVLDALRRGRLDTSSASQR